MTIPLLQTTAPTLERFLCLSSNKAGDLLYYFVFAISKWEDSSFVAPRSSHTYTHTMTAFPGSFTALPTDLIAPKISDHPRVTCLYPAPGSSNFPDVQLGPGLQA